MNDFIPKGSGMKNVHAVLFHCKFYSSPESGRRICTHKAFYNMVDLSKAELGLTRGEYSSSVPGVGGAGTLGFLCL